MTTSPTPNSGRRWPLVKADLGGCRIGALAGHVGNSLPSSVGPFVQSTAGSPTRVSRLVSLALNELPDAAFLVFDAEMRFVPCRGAAVTDNQLTGGGWTRGVTTQPASPRRFLSPDPPVPA